MNQDPAAHHHEDALDHLEEEIRHLEGVTRWGRPIRIGLLVLGIAAAVGGIIWFLASPPPTTSARKSYVEATGARIDVFQPKSATLADPPSRFEWEGVAGRMQYIVRIYVKGQSLPVLERMVTTAGLDLTPDEQARMPRGNNFVWTVVAQGKDGSSMGTGQGTFKVR